MITTEDVVEFILRNKGFTAIVFLLVAAYNVRVYRARWKVLTLGGYGSQHPVYLPMGIDFITKAFLMAKKDELLVWFEDMFAKHGKKNNPFTIDATASGERIILTADPENIKAILATQFADYGKGEQFHRDWYPFLGNSIFSTDHQLWHDSRQLIRPQFVKDRVSDLNTFEKHSSILIDQLGHGETVDVKDLFFKFTLDAATEFLLGRSVGTLTYGNGAFADAFAGVQAVQANIVYTGPMNFVIPRGAYTRYLDTINQFCEPFIEHALALSPEELEKKTKSDEGYTFLHAIAAYTRDRRTLRDQIVAVLLAGRDTTACTLSYTLYELSRSPSIVSKLRNEIKNVVGFDRKPTYANLKDMKYLNHTINEALRLYPSVPNNIRVALKDTTLPSGGGRDGTGPIGVLEGTRVAYSTHYMQLRPDLYPPTTSEFPHPHVFSPERWDKWHPQSWNYLPFNGGPRICVGQHFALTEMAYTLVRILQKYSRIEDRNQGIPDPKTVVSSGSTAPGTGAYKKFLETRVGMSSDIVLMPSKPVLCAFYS